MVSQACDSGELIEGLSGDEHAHSGLDIQLVGDWVRALGGDEHGMDVVAGQETCIVV